MTGRIIAIDGIDGAGKSTQVSLLLSYLSSIGVPVTVTGHGQASPIKEVFRRVLQKGIRDRDKRFWSHLLAADYAWRIENVILPSLENSQYILADRYLLSAFAYESARGTSLDFLYRTYSFVPSPSCTILLNIEPEVAQQRLMSRSKLDPTEQDLEFQNLCRSIMIEFASSFDAIILDGNQSIEALFDHIKSIVSEIHKSADRGGSDGKIPAS